MEKRNDIIKKFLEDFFNFDGTETPSSLNIDEDKIERSSYEKDGVNYKVESYEDGNTFYYKKIITSNDNGLDKADNTPSVEGRIKLLEKMLSEKIKKEEYEECAKIRDELKTLKS